MPPYTQTTIVELFQRKFADQPQRQSLLVRDGGQYQAVTWRELACQAARRAQWLRDRGVAAGDRVIQVSENRYEWVLADLAIQLAGAIHVPVHATLAGPQVVYQIQDCGARIVLLSGQEQIQKLAQCADSLPPGLQFFSYDPPLDASASLPLSQLSESLPTAQDVDVQRWLTEPAQVTPDSWATILYTSGTTGEPKGVVLNQRNLAFNALATLERFHQEEHDVRLAFLPLSHIFARTCDLYTWLAGNCTLALAESRETVLRDCAAVSPTLLNGVPYFFDKVYRRLVSQGLADQHGVLQRLLGGRMRVCCSGGAALADHVYDFYWRHRVPLVQGYGLTETSPVISVATESETRRGSVGQPLPGVEVKLAEDGEILTRGPHVMVGYYKSPEETERMVRDGWLYTGDYGRITDGFLFISGRKKEILVTNGGKNVAPVLLESLLTQDPLIAQAIVLGDQRNFLAALIVPEEEVLGQWIERERLAIPSLADARTHPQVIELFQERIEEQLRGVSRYEQVRSFALLQQPFSIERGELTPKLSLRRAVIQQHYQREIDALYCGEPNSVDT